MNEPENLYPVGLAHWAPMGGIIQGFARFEYLMAVIVSFVTKAALVQTVVMMAELNYTGKRNTTRSIIHMSTLPAEQKEKFKWFLGEIHKHNSLRNQIAHSTWVSGTRPNSIKPFGISIRDRIPKIIGLADSERDWTVADLEACTDEVNRVYSTLKDYMDEIGLTPDILPKSSARNLESS